jgi:hypothetical protein
MAWKDEVAEAIEHVEHSRYTHVTWTSHLSEIDAPIGEPVVGNVGDIEHHERCIRDYDQVLGVLQRVLTEAVA